MAILARESFVVAGVRPVERNSRPFLIRCFDMIGSCMGLAGQWYTSGTFWAAAGAVAVLMTGAIATYVAFVLANPVRRLECAMSAAPLLQGPTAEIPGRLQITWDGAELRDPHILEVNLTSRGRRDIASEDFDQPLEFRVGAKILAILRTASGSSSTPFRAVSFEDDLLKVGPGLIRSRQSIGFTLLAIGRDPILSSSAAAVRDVDVEVLPTGRSSRRWSGKVKAVASLAAGAATAGLVLIGVLIGNSANGHASPPPASPPTASGTPTSSSTPTSSATPTPIPTLALAALSAAETELKSDSLATQISGISKLQSIMTTVPSSQPAAIGELAKYIQTDSPAGNNDQPVTSTIQTAINVLRNRVTAKDNGVVIDLSNANLTSANLAGIDLDNANLVNADFDTATLNGASLRGADLNYAFLGGASLNGTNLNGANLDSASFYQTIMCHGSTPTQPQRGYNCSASG